MRESVCVCVGVTVCVSVQGPVSVHRESAQIELKVQQRYKANSVHVAILLAIYRLCCLGLEAVRLDAPVNLAVRQQRKQSMVWVVVVFDDFPDLLFLLTGLQRHMTAQQDCEKSVQENTYTYTVS